MIELGAAWISLKLSSKAAGVKRDNGLHYT